MTRTIKLGRHFALPWRWPDASVELGDLYHANAYADVARQSEAAGFDFLLRADTFTFEPGGAAKAPALGLDPVVSLTVAAAATRHIGIVPTISSTFSQPYSLARSLLSLDLLSGGRAGWNVVTSFAGEKKFGLRELPPQEERYARAAELLEILHGLWRSWDPQALKFDRESGRFADPALIRTVEHDGAFFRMTGASSLPPSPQGWPVQVQAGASGPGKAFAAKHADVVYSASTDITHAQRIASELKALALANGRPPGSLLVTPGINLVTAATDREAEEAFQAVRESFDYEAGRRELEFLFGGVTLADIDLDDPIPQDRLPDVTSLRRRQSRPALFIELAQREGATLRKVLDVSLIGGGHYAFHGSYDRLADELIRWFDAGAADGFVLGFLGSGTQLGNQAQFDAFVENVIPRLRDRGYLRKTYAGSTLRENLGLPLPPHARSFDFAGQAGQ